jgi:hypothetical protein
VDGHAGHIRGDDEDVGLDLAGKDRAGQVFVDDGIHPSEFALLADYRDAPATAADDNEAHLDQFLDLAISTIASGVGHHHPPEALSV